MPDYRDLPEFDHLRDSTWFGQTMVVRAVLRRESTGSKWFSGARYGVTKKWVRHDLTKPVLAYHLGRVTLQNGVSEHLGEDGICWKRSDSFVAVRICRGAGRKPEYALMDDMSYA